MGGHAGRRTVAGCARLQNVADKGDEVECVQRVFVARRVAADDAGHCEVGDAVEKVVEQEDAAKVFPEPGRLWRQAVSGRAAAGGARARGRTCRPLDEATAQRAMGMKKA